MAVEGPPGVDLLYEQAPCGLLLMGPRGELLHFNALVAKWLHYEREELAAKKLQDVLSVGGRIFYQTHLAPLLRMQGSVAEVKLDLLRKDGRTLPALVNLVEWEHGGGKLLHAAVFIAEDRHKYERELLTQRQRAERLADEQARSQKALAEAHGEMAERALFAEKLVGVVSHDIRNPLSVIHMSAVLLERLQPTPQQAPVVARIARAVAQVQHLVGDLLDFTQARLGRGLTVAPRDIDIHDTVAECIGELAHAFPKVPLRHTHAGPGAWTADPYRITQAIGNLVGNAVKHGAAGQPVTVHSEVGPDACELRVHNFGEPIPPEQIDGLFEPLVQGEGRAPGAGIGLGLYIVQQIASRHGGTATAASSEAGTVFTVRLPRLPAADT